MSTSHRKSHGSHRGSLHHFRKGAHAVTKTVTRTIVSLGDLVSAAFEVAGSPQQATVLVNHMLRHGDAIAR